MPVSPEEERQFSEDQKKRMAELRQGLCEEDKATILDLTLRQLAEEFQWPEWLVIDMVEFVLRNYQVGREELYCASFQKRAGP